MDATKLSRKRQVTTPNAPFQTTELAGVAGMLKEQIHSKTDKETKDAVKRDARRKWRP